MKQIFKNKEPKSLIEHRSKGGKFDDLKKDELRECLLNEQGYICCYCMKRIPESSNNPGCKIEHFKSQSQYEDLQLEYSNMLTSCMGGEGEPSQMHTCDTAKKDKELFFNPANPTINIEEFTKYNPFGEIYSLNDQLNKELNEALKLNIQPLIKRRKQIYDMIYKNIIIEGKRRCEKHIQKRYYEKEKERLLSKNKNGKFPEYCMVGVYLINKKLKKLV